MNQVNLIGRVGKDPEVKSFDWGKIANTSLATSRKIKDKDGSKKEITQWHNLSFHGTIVDIVEKYVKKGDQIAVTGEIQYREYEKEGVKKYVTDIYINSLEMLGRNKSENDEGTSAPTTQNPPLKPQEPIDDLPF
ncbi:MAG: single-stranded DNA-binding protein [Bacteroidales bacterium]|nr:single-stranded DNA-binding protein [Bacteroidales bacterium]